MPKKEQNDFISFKNFFHQQIIEEEELLEEGRYQKYKVGNQPKSKNKNKQEIMDRLSDFTKLKPESVDFIHLPGENEKEFANYNSNKSLLIKISDLSVLKDLQSYLDKFADFEVIQNERNFIVTKGIGKVKFSISSGNGFFFASSGEQENPLTHQQETGTIKTIEFYQLNNREPSHSEINEIVGFSFDEKWYRNFIFQLEALKEFIPDINSTKYTIDLDSDSHSIGKSLYSMLKQKFKYKDSKDNWNPADIWVYEGNKRNKILTELSLSSNIVEFNLKLQEMFNEKILIGVSLKKMLRKSSPQVVSSGSLKSKFDLQYKKTEYNVTNTYYDLMTTGYPEKFMIRVRSRAKTITKASDIKIYFEGKKHRSTEFLGAISKSLIKSTFGADVDYVPTGLDVTKETIKTMADKVERTGFMKVSNVDKLKDDDKLKLIHTYLMLRYALYFFTADKDFLNKAAMAAHKLSSDSSIHLKIGG